MNTLIVLAAILGVAAAQVRNVKDCDPQQSGSSIREVQDIYQRPSAYDDVGYVPHLTYGPPDPIRSPPRNNYQYDSSEGGSYQRPTYTRPPNYSDFRGFPPVYGPPPRSRVNIAAGIYDEYEDIRYAPRPPPHIRNYNYNYAQQQPYHRNLGYDHRHEYRLPVYYAPLIPDGFIPVRPAPPTPATTVAPTTEETHSSSSTGTYTISNPSEEEVYEDENIRRQPAIAVSASIPHRFNPFAGIARLFRASIIAKKNKIGIIPRLIKGSVNPPSTSY